MLANSKSRIDGVKSIPFFLVHLAAFGVFFVPFNWNLVGLCIATFYIRMFAITAGYHRYFSHRAYKVNRVSQFLLACLGSSCLQKGVLWWAANHRLHHLYSDRSEDLHSPLQRGFWWSHVGWILSNDHEETRVDQIPDLVKFPELRWINKHHLFPGVALGLGLFLVGGWGAFFWGFVLSTVVLWHATFTINSLAHVYGSQRYDTRDTSRNNFWLAVLTLGEGWHNNHHCYMSSANQGFFWWEIDGSFYVLKILSWLGVVTDLKLSPVSALDVRRIRRDPGHPLGQARPLESGIQKTVKLRGSDLHGRRPIRPDAEARPGVGQP